MTVTNAIDDPGRPPIERLIGFDTMHRPLESWYGFIGRLIRANLLNDLDVRQQLPAHWVRWAFAPHEVHADDLPAIGPYFDGLLNSELKLRPVEWQPFPELSSTPHECLRGCPRCLEAGYHSYAFQGDLIAQCPVHEAALVHRCPHCDTQLLWHTRSPSFSAFRCPTGCILLEGTHSGLHVPFESAITAALQQHLAWTKTLRETLMVASGPVHIAYPPYIAVGPLRTPPLPSKGLLPAMLHALQAKGVAFPAFNAFHEQSHGQWAVEVNPWIWSDTVNRDEEQLEGYRRAFRRGAYRTHVPITDRENFERWLVKNESEHKRWHDSNLEEGNCCAVFSLPSYMLTNNELMALRRLLSRGTAPDLASAHYQRLLTELLEHARLRRFALDILREPSPHVTVAEAFDAIVKTQAGYWHVSGRTRGDDESRRAWQDFREPAEMASGIIHVARKHGPR